MDVLSIISIAITVIGFIVKMSSRGDSDNGSNYQPLTTSDIFPETTLDGILICYESFKSPNFNMRQAELNLRSNQYGDFKVLAADLQGDCLYINVQFIDVFDKKSKNNEVVTFNNNVSTYFSVNHLEGTDNVVVYGCTNYNQRIKDGYRDVAKEIRSIISR